MKDNFTVEWLPFGAKAALAWGASVWMEVPNAMRTLLIFMLADIVTGVLASIRNKRLDSTIAAKGITKKLAMIVMVVICHPIEQFFAAEFQIPFEVGLEKWIAVAYILGEIISVIENLQHCGAPIPAMLVDVLLKAKKTIKWSDTQQIKALEDKEPAAPAVPPQPPFPPSA